MTGGKPEHEERIEMEPELRRDLSQFHTPRALAEKMVAWSGVEPGDRVLEPSAGGGSIVGALLGAGAQVVAIERDAQWAAKMSSDARLAKAEIVEADFLFTEPTQLGRFDLALMNPPFEKQLDAMFIAKALAFTGRAVALTPVGVLFGKKKNEALWRRNSLTGLVHLTHRPKFIGAGGSFDCVVVEVTRGAGHALRRCERWDERF